MRENGSYYDANSYLGLGSPQLKRASVHGQEATDVSRDHAKLYNFNIYIESNSFHEF